MEHLSAPMVMDERVVQKSSPLSERLKSPTTIGGLGPPCSSARKASSSVTVASANTEELFELSADVVSTEARLTGMVIRLMLRSLLWDERDDTGDAGGDGVCTILGGMPALAQCSGREAALTPPVLQ